MSKKAAWCGLEAAVQEEIRDKFPAFELIRPDKGEHIRIYADGRVAITPLKAKAPPAQSIINRIPSLIRSAFLDGRSEGRHG